MAIYLFSQITFLIIRISLQHRENLYYVKLKPKDLLECIKEMETRKCILLREFGSLMKIRLFKI